MIRRRTPALQIAVTAAIAGAGLVGLAAWTRATPAIAIRRAFQVWANGNGSIYDLMDANAEVVIPGSLPNCGSWRKDAFLREVALPFVARFSKPPVPRLRSLWSSPKGVVVRADAAGTTRDGRPYVNDYVFQFAMLAGRVIKVTEFLDMAAFNVVWDTVNPESDHAG